MTAMHITNPIELSVERFVRVQRGDRIDYVHPSDMPRLRKRVEEHGTALVDLVVLDESDVAAVSAYMKEQGIR